ncbi:putative glucose-induced degradation protein 8 [Vairimorpha necatrix]|uniref:Glucose-induced degradation protein 8 n=1 Tax=Vairimorpha necatrix TaxID=6039 RepID=A0AAX4JF35_9MICR
MEKHKEIKLVLKKIIQDHLHFSCSETTFTLLNNKEDKEVLNDMSTRRNLIFFIKNNESHNAFLYMKDFLSCEDELFVKLAKLSFIDFISNDKVQEGIEFAKKYFTNLSDKPLLSLVGYEKSSCEEFKKISESVNREEIMSRVNSYVFKKYTSRGESLLHSTIAYYNTLQNNSE